MARATAANASAPSLPTIKLSIKLTETWPREPAMMGNANNRFP